MKWAKTKRATRHRRQIAEQGFSLITGILILIVIAGVGLGGWITHRHTHSRPGPTSVRKSVSHEGSPNTHKPPDPYAGWKTATSLQAKFSIRYPTSWTYSEALGDKDGVEHITIDSTKFHITIDTSVGHDVSDSAAPASTCTDCLQTFVSKPITIPNLGKASIDTVAYSLDNGRGNALILRMSDGTYYIPSKDMQNTFTAFRAISNLSSEAAYQEETPSQFESNPDYSVAQLILQSIKY